MYSIPDSVCFRGPTKSMPHWALDTDQGQGQGEVQTDPSSRHLLLALQARVHKLENSVIHAFPPEAFRQLCESCSDTEMAPASFVSVESFEDPSYVFILYHFLQSAFSFRRIVVKNTILHNKGLALLSKVSLFFLEHLLFFYHEIHWVIPMLQTMVNIMVQLGIHGNSEREKTLILSCPVYSHTGTFNRGKSTIEITCRIFPGGGGEESYA